MNKMAANSGRTGTAMLRLLVFVVILSAWRLNPVCGYDSNMESAKERMNHGADYMQDAKEDSDSWTNWARDKISEGLGLRHENAKMAAQQMMDKAGDITTKTKDKLSDVASGAAEYTSHKAGEAKDAMMDMAGNTKESLKEEAGYASGKMAGGTDETVRAYEGAKQKLGETYESAKDSMSGSSAKASYEAAKEKVSEATGNLGAKMEEL